MTSSGWKVASIVLSVALTVIISLLGIIFAQDRSRLLAVEQKTEINTVGRNVIVERIEAQNKTLDRIEKKLDSIDRELKGNGR